MWENLQAFQAAINWREPFILSILAFHILTLFVCYYVRKYGGMASRLILLVALSLMVRSAEWANKKCAAHWHLFATQNYFDPRGIFAGIFLSFPLLLLAFGMLLSYLMEARQLMRDLQGIKLERHKKKRSKVQTVNKVKRDSQNKADVKQD